MRTPHLLTASLLLSTTLMAACVCDPGEQTLCPEDTGRGCPEDSDPPQDSAPPEDTQLPADTGDTDEPPPPLTVALYDDAEDFEAGAWGPGLDAIEAAITAAGHSVQRIHRADLNGQPGLLQGFDVLLFGGGFAYPGYTVHISDRGKARIQEYIQGGGAFVGICAGAYFACDSLDYEGHTWADESGYDTDLYPSVCGGPVHEVSSYPLWAPATIDFPGHDAYQDFEQAPFQRQLYYAGGPFFPELPASAEVLATYGDQGPHLGQPAAVTLPYGDGRVVLWGPHPEVLAVDEHPETTMDPHNRELYAMVVRWAAGNP